VEAFVDGCPKCGGNVVAGGVDVVAAHDRVLDLFECDVLLRCQVIVSCAATTGAESGGENGFGIKRGGGKVQTPALAFEVKMRSGQAAAAWNLGPGIGDQLMSGYCCPLADNCAVDVDIPIGFGSDLNRQKAVSDLADNS